MSEINSAIEFLFTLIKDKNVDESLRNALGVVIEQLCLTTIDLENCQRDLKAVSEQLTYTHCLNSLLREAFGPSGDNGTSPSIQ